MLQLLRHIFGCSAKQEKYPKATIREAIERTIERTDPWLKVVSGYKIKLRPAIILSLDHAARLVNSLPPPILVEFGPNGSCPSLAAFFTTTAEMLKTFQKDRDLTSYLRDHKPASKQIIALLMMEKAEKIIFGAELSGNVVSRDVPQTSVTFLNQRFLEPSDNGKDTRRKLESRAFDHLLRIAHMQIATTKSVRKDLERSQTILQSKLALLKSGEENLHGPESNNIQSIAATEEQLQQVEAKLIAQGRADKVLDTYLDIAINVLSHPEEHLWETVQHIILDQGGIKRAQAKENDSEFDLQELSNSVGQQWVMLLIALPIDDLRKFLTTD
jgi:hypothetical protein